MHKELLVACHECDLIHRIGSVPEGDSALCRRCGCILFSHKKDSLDRSLALTLAGLLLFIVANAYPLLEIKMEGRYQSTTLFGGVEALYSGGSWEIALLVFCTAILFPFLELLIKLHILVPLKLKRRPWKMIPLLNLLQVTKPWGMMDVFMLGILVSMVKLLKMVTVIPGYSLYGFFALIFIMAAGSTCFDTHALWEKAGE